MERVESISEKILELDADVIVLQEVFHKKARNKLIEKLKSHYPNFTSRGKSSWLGVSSGILIMSKHPISEEQFNYFKRAKGADAIAKKGFISIKIRFNKKQVNILGTHLQAGSGARIKAIRKSQLEQISKKIEQQPKSWILAGDFNVMRNGNEYETLEALLKTTNRYPSSKLNASANFPDQELFPSSGKAKWIDFILLRSSKWKHKRMRILSPKKDDKILSDHAIVLATILL